MSDNAEKHRDVDAFSGVETTGHEWDGIKELDNPMPRWWLWTFYATIVFAIGYVIYYPSIPLLEDSTRGLSGKTNRSLLKAELESVRASRGVLLQQVAATPIDKIRSNDDLYRFALAGGKSNFKVYCTQCHGSGAEGSPGYPNLNDDDWLWGGDLNSIYTTIAHGVRDESDEESRTSLMPAFGKDEIIEGEEIRAVVEHVLKLSGREYDQSLAEAGAEVFSDNCSSCHGEDGRGGREQGAPNLADALSLYGGTRAALRAQVSSPRHGAMPPWLARLGEAQVKQLAVYVHSLGGGEKEKLSVDK